MKKFDKDGDGKLNEEEKAELRKKMAERGAGRKVPPFIMEKFDKDGDGKLSEDERAEARKAMEARRAEMIEKFDKDGDGKLNEDERKAAIASRTKPGGKGKKKARREKRKSPKDSFVTKCLLLEYFLKVTILRLLFTRSNFLLIRIMSNPYFRN